MQTTRRYWIAAAVLVLAALTGCRGTPSADPPVHLNPNMDTQDKYKAQRKSTFFKDGRAMRPEVAGTVARGFLKENDALWRGCVDDRDCDHDLDGDGEIDGKYVTTSPIIPTQAHLERGQERYNIFCAPCHDRSGYGKGRATIPLSGIKNVPSYHQDYLRKYPDGKLFSVISNGSASRMMKGYANQIPVKDRWAIVSYIRALQRSQHASLEDVPSAERGKL